MEPFVPLFSNSHLATIAGNFWRRPDPGRLAPLTSTYLEPEPGVQVLVESRQPSSPSRGSLIFLHGLEGSSRAGYIRSMSHEALRRGYAVHGLNMRTCGGTAAISRTMYHAGLTADVHFLVQRLQQQSPAPIHLAGFSLGGNVVLKLAGELGSAATSLIASVTAVSTPIDLAACVRQLGAKQNLLYARRFVKALKRRVRERARLVPGSVSLNGLDQVRTVFEFDDLITAPAFGFHGAAHYYETQSAHNFLDGIRVPTLIVQAKDDPMIPPSVFEHSAFTRNPHLRLHWVNHGGHLGFLARSGPRFWLDALVLNWVDAHTAPVPSTRPVSV